MTIAEQTLRAIAEELGLPLDSSPLAIVTAVCELKAREEQFRGAVRLTRQALSESLANGNTVHLADRGRELWRAA